VFVRFSDDVEDQESSSEDESDQEDSESEEEFQNEFIRDQKMLSKLKRGLITKDVRLALHLFRSLDLIAFLNP
jgi:hypothetical protein